MNYQILFDEYKPKFTYTCSKCGKVYERDHEVKTELKFCSQSCAGSYGGPTNKDLVDESFVKGCAKPVPGFEGYWFAEDNQLFSNRVKRKDGKYLRCSLQEKHTGRQEYKILNKRINVKTLRMLCGYSEQE